MTAAPTAADSARPQLLFFFHPTDGKARRVEGFIAQVLQRRRNHETVAIRRIDVSRHAHLVEKFRLGATPALVVVHDRKVKGRIEQPRGCAAIEDLLEPWLR